MTSSKTLTEGHARGASFAARRGSAPAPPPSAVESHVREAGSHVLGDSRGYCVPRECGPSFCLLVGQSGRPELRQTRTNMESWGWSLAGAHARSGDRLAIVAYVGGASSTNGVFTVAGPRPTRRTSRGQTIGVPAGSRRSRNDRRRPIALRCRHSALVQEETRLRPLVRSRLRSSFTLSWRPGGTTPQATARRSRSQYWPLSRTRQNSACNADRQRWR